MYNDNLFAIFFIAEELAEEHSSRYSTFIIGVISYTILLLAL